MTVAPDQGDRIGSSSVISGAPKASQEPMPTMVHLACADSVAGIAHLFCEIHLRMKSIGLATDGKFALPVTQTELADTVGVSTVHANRVLQSLRSKNLIEFKGGQVLIPDVARLGEECGFDPNYLHLGGGKSGS